MDPTQALTGILDDGISIFGTAGINAGLQQVNSAPGFPYGYYSPYPPGYAVITPSGGTLTTGNAPLSGGAVLLIIAVVFWFLTRKKG